MSILAKYTGATVPYVVDGDTVDVQFIAYRAGGDTLIKDIRGRANRIDAYASSTPAGKQAKLFAQKFFTGQIVDIELVERYKYMPTPYASKEYAGEYMVELVVNGINYSDALVAAGLATYWDGVGKGYGLAHDFSK